MDDQANLFEETTHAPALSEEIASKDILVVDPPDELLENSEVEIPKNVESEQIQLLHVPEWHEEHWKQMPEFVQKDCMPFKTIFVHFETRADMEAFAKLVGQKVGLTTPSIWYPEATIEHWNKQWVDSRISPTVEDDEVETIEE